MNYRCENPRCKTTTFQADRPVCPTCRTDGSDLRFANYIVELATIHFNPPTHIDAVRLNHRACDGGAIAGFVVTNEPRVVNCPACMATEAYRRAVIQAGSGKVLEEADFGIEVASGAIQKIPGDGQQSGKPCAAC
jgi:hypothetical protein